MSKPKQSGTNLLELGRDYSRSGTIHSPIEQESLLKTVSIGQGRVDVFDGPYEEGKSSDTCRLLRIMQLDA